MTTKVKNPLLDLESEGITGILMDGVGNGINMDGAVLKNLPAPVDDNDAARGIDVAGSTTPVGVGPLPWAGTEGNVPTGWLLCDGTIYNIATYPALHAVIQNTYGGDNITTFAVPDIRGRVPLGKDDMGGAAAGVVPSATNEGDTGGSETHTLIISEMPAHTHSGSATDSGSHTHTASTASDGAHTHTGSADSDGDHVHTGGVTSTDGNQAGGGTNAAIVGNTGLAGAHTHTLSVDASVTHTHTVTVDMVANHTHTLAVDSEGGGNAHSNMQPYMVFNYIIKAD